MIHERLSTYHNVIGYRTHNQCVFPHCLRMSVSYSEAGINVPTFSRFRILLRLRWPNKSLSRPPDRPSLGKVEAGGHGSGSSKQNGPPRVDQGASKRGEHSGSPFCDETNLDILPTSSQRLTLLVAESYCGTVD